MIIKEVEVLEEAKICNELLNKLVKDEKRFNDNIDDNTKINNYYENFLKSDNSKLFIAKDNDNIMGYIFIKITNPKQNAELYKESIIDALYVKEEYRNKGVATTLIKKAIEYSKQKDAKRISINVISNNEVALKLYYKLGFENFSFSLKQKI